MADQVRHRLAVPLVITARGPDGERTEEVAELVVHPLAKARDLRCLDGVVGQVAQGIALIAHCCRIPVAQAEELSVEDFARLSTIVGDFLPDGLMAGDTP